MDVCALEGLVTPGSLVRDPDIMRQAATDRAVFNSVGTPAAWVRARTVEDVQATLAFAFRTRTPVVPQGARTGLAGASSAVDGCILLDVAGLDAVIEVNEAERTATVQPGVITNDLKAAAAAKGLWYPPDPGSVEISTIGGNIATNAGGFCCVKYGVTGDYVRELVVALADGTLTRVGHRTAKGVAGYNLAQTFVGSEGTLGVIVEATVKLRPAQAPRVTAVATFADAAAAGRCVAAFTATGATPALCEFLDGAVIDMIREFTPHRLDPAGAMLIVQTDGDAAVRDLESFGAFARLEGALDVAVSDDPADSEALVAARRQVNAASEGYAAAHGGGTLVDDVCLPLARVAEYLAALDALQERTGLVIATAAHIGDGNLHPSVYFDASRPEQVALAREVFGELMTLGLAMGGTITGEHGVGRLKSPWLRDELDEGSRRLHLALKQAFDPSGILNPGSMLAGL